MKRTFFILSLNLILFLLSYTPGVYAATGDFNSRADGNWSAIATWSKKLTGTSAFVNASADVIGTSTLYTSELNVGDVLMLQATTGTIRGTVLTITDDTHLTFVANASATASGAYSKEATPTSADGVITITHAITVTADVTVDQVVYTGGNTLTINSGVTFTIADGSGTDFNNTSGSPPLAVNGTLNIVGTLTGFNAVTIGSGGIITVDGTFTENAGTPTITINGTLTINGTMTGTHDVTINSAAVVNVAGTFNLTPGNPNLTVNSGGNLSLTGTASMALASVSQMDVSGTVTLSGSSAITTTRGNGGYTVQILSGGIIDMSGTSGLSVAGSANARIDILSGGTIKLASGATVTGSGQLRLCNGASMNIGSVDGITASGATGNIQCTSTRTYGGVNNAGTAQGTNTTNYTYNGTAAQVTGNGLPSSLNNLTISNTGGAISSTAGIAVGGTFQIDAGAIFTPGAAHIISGAGTLTGSGMVQVTRTAATADFSTQYSISNKTLANLMVDYAGAGETVNALTYGSLTINNAGGLSLGGATTVNGTLTLTNGALSIGANTLTINGDISTISGSLTGGASSNITIGGSGASTILPAVTLNNLTLDRANGISLGGVVVVGGTLTFTNGLLTSSSSNLLTINNDAVVSGVANTRFVNGPVKKVGDDIFTFPIGKSGTGYQPLAISAPSVNTDAFTAEYIRSGGDALGGVNSPITSVSNCEYWTLDPTAGTSSVNVTLNWNANSTCGGPGQYISGMTSIGVAHFNGSVWNSFGKDGGTTGDVNAGSVTWNSVSTFSPFTLGSDAETLPVRFGNIKATKRANGIEVGWTNFTETDVMHYIVERSSNGIQFSSIGQVRANQNNGDRADYNFMDLSPNTGSNFYRIMSVEIDNKTLYSTIVKVNAVNGFTGINIYPNPVKGSQFILQAANLPEGLYNLRVYSSTGQLILGQTFNFNGASVSQSIQLPASARPGVYSLLLRNEGKSLQKIFVIQ